MKTKEFTTTRAPSNPLEPIYKLQSFEPVPPVEPRFIRDQMAINDIEKARPTPMLQDHFLRETNYIKDIEGSHPKKDYVVLLNWLVFKMEVETRRDRPAGC
jgi:hypothetical protein